LLRFKTGAFLAGAPVLPVIIKYDPKDPVSPAWESIDAFWHTFLMLANPVHFVTMVELPVYVPSEEEKADPALYAENVRKYMLRVGGFKPSEASLVDSRAYIALLEVRFVAVFYVHARVSVSQGCLS
jgi:lysophosphatidylcholine acyltransferase / lyso-PAF acetyltransferase